MNIYYEIPQNYSYVNFAKTFIQLKLYTAKYVQQFTVSNKTILYVGNKKISTLPTTPKFYHSRRIKQLPNLHHLRFAALYE